MKILGLATLVFALCLSACHTGQPFENGSKKFHEIHSSVFGCKPHNWGCLPVPEPKAKVLDAVDDGCGKPIYKKPDCGSCPKPETDCPDGNCGVPAKKLDATAAAAPCVK